MISLGGVVNTPSYICLPLDMEVYISRHDKGWASLILCTGCVIGNRDKERKYGACGVNASDVVIRITENVNSLIYKFSALTNTVILLHMQV